MPVAITYRTTYRPKPRQPTLAFFDPATPFKPMVIPGVPVAPVTSPSIVKKKRLSKRQWKRIAKRYLASLGIVGTAASIAFTTYQVRQWAKVGGITYDNWDPSVDLPAAGWVQVATWDPKVVHNNVFEHNTAVVQRITMVNKTVPPLYRDNHFVFDPHGDALAAWMASGQNAGFVVTADQSAWVHRGYHTIQPNVEHKAGTTYQFDRDGSIPAPLPIAEPMPVSLPDTKPMAWPLTQPVPGPIPGTWELPLTRPKYVTHPDPEVITKTDFTPKPKPKPAPAPAPPPLFGGLNFGINVPGKTVTVGGSASGRPPKAKWKRERKSVVKGFAYRVLRMAADAMGEGLEMMQIIIDVSSYEYDRSVGGSLAYNQMHFLLLQDGLETVDWREFQNALMHNQIEDMAFGAIGQGSAGASQELGLTFGAQTGLAM